MGRGGKRRFRGRGGKSSNGERQPYVKYEDLPRDNEAFRKYYTAQQLVSEEEFSEMVEAMRTALPTSFRITGSRKQATDIHEQIMTELIPSIKGVSIEGAETEAPHPLEWYPNELAWQFSIPRFALKRSPELSRFHAFLVTETEVGNISRQEAVSMVPPLLLDVHGDHFVLDMCAAPGSKTAQLVEALQADADPAVPPRGLVVANDADYKRACMLVHQMNRLNSPNVIVTNHSGEHFPNIYVPASKEGPQARGVVQFDRILCDVPCTGDGTTRKNVRVWETWKPEDAYGLNPLQSRILQRAAYLLKTGGRLVYSTCSLNPVENEAVVAHVLDKFGGALKLVDVSAQLPALKRRPGLHTWKIMTRDGANHDSAASVKPGDVSRSVYKNLDNFLPLAPARMEELHIERCMRIYPHLQNTGGFFIAVIEKVAPVSVVEKRAAAQAKQSAADVNACAEAGADQEAEIEAETEIDDGQVAAKRAKLDDAQHSEESDAAPALYRPDRPRDEPVLRENPFVFLDPAEDELKTIFDFYGIKDSVPRCGFLSRIENERFRSVYYVADSVRQLMELGGQRMRVVNTGIRVFGRNCVKDAGCEFRLVCEGVAQLMPHLADKYIVDVGFHDLKVLLESVNPLFTALSEECQMRIKAVDPLSSIVVCYDPSKHDPDGAVPDEEKPHVRLTAMLAIPCWRGHASLSVHVDKAQLSSLIRRVLGRVVDRKDTGSSQLANNIRSQDKTPTSAPGSPASGADGSSQPPVM
ncbi:tRNA (cytosine-5-)-methyltransferase ncl1 [Coemansia guatemalensis]|uniref:tRNA (Cytosine-5-)-methyltransferase ncl1 n=1 Tax=Coemansia guatemalensis TaxID=2761395 RepID=A0A9W8HR13_9FUNG|nr:tRNA (cytosine-5-)-methyltransferase ncl1 [Coemansia guatemalensis]